MVKEVVKVKIAGEHMNISVKEGRQGKVTMVVSSNVSKIKKETTDKAEMLSILKHFESNGTVIKGDIRLMRQVIKGEDITMASVEESNNFLTLFEEVLI